MKKSIIIIQLMSASIYLNAQSIEKNVIATGGNTYTSGNTSVEFTVGEVFTSTLSSANNSITQGFHQPNLFVARMVQDENGELHDVTEDQVTEKLIDQLFKQLDMQVFPNPTTDFVNIKLSGSEFENLQVTVSTIEGKLIMKTLMTSQSTQIDFTNLISGTYIVRIKNENGDLSNTYKVVKTN